MMRKYRFEFILSILVVLTIVSIIVTIHIGSNEERVKCESLFYMSETPKDSLLIIRADPNCNGF